MRFRLGASSRISVFIFSSLCAGLPRMQSFRVGLNALLSDDRIDSFRFDDESFWRLASEYYRGNIGLVDYLFFPANGNLMLLPRLLFIIWRSDDWIETRFIFGLIPGTLALALTTYLLIRLLLVIGVASSAAFGIGMLFAYSLHSQDLFNALAMNGFYMFQLPLIIWLLTKLITDRQPQLWQSIGIVLISVIYEGRHLTLPLLILLATALLTTSSRRSRNWLLATTSGVAATSLMMYGIAMKFGSPAASFTQPDYAEYPPTSLVDGVWIGLRAHALHIYWLWTNTRIVNFETLGGADPIPNYGTHVAIFCLALISAIAAVLILQQKIYSSTMPLRRFRVLLFCLVVTVTYVAATAIARGDSGWDWNATRYSPYAGVVAVLLLGLVHSLSVRRSWQVLSNAALSLLIATQFVHEWVKIGRIRLEGKLLDTLAAYGSLVVAGTMFIALLSQIVKDIEEERSRAGAATTQ